MRKKLLVPYLLLILFSCSDIKAQVVNAGDSLALVDLYNSTNGQGWINHTNWLTAAPVSSWFGIFVSNGSVTGLSLQNNNLTGVLPPTLVNLTNAGSIGLAYNQITGSIPSSYGNFANLYGLDLGNNKLSGTLPASFLHFRYRSTFSIGNNKFNFDGLEYFFSQMSDTSSTVYCNNQADLPIHQNGNLLSVSAGGTLANNTYRWYRGTSLVATITGDSTYSTGGIPGAYNVEITNSVLENPGLNISFPRLVLQSISKPATEDSLALVDLYNSTNGQNWINKANWLTNAPLSSWDGVTLRRGRVIRLSLQHNQLTGSLPPSIGNLDALTELLFYNNSITENLPASIVNLANLRLLLFSYNNFTGGIPDSISKLKKLNYLNLDNNLLSGPIPADVGNLAELKGLSLSNNKFSGLIPSSFGRMTNLVSLSLNSNELSGNIPDSLGELGNLSDMFLSINQLTGTIPGSFSKLSHLQSLHIDHNHLSGPLPVSLASIPSLFSLNINTNKFNFDGLEAFSSTQSFTYAPQANIHVNRNANLLAVSAGGTLANDSFQLFRDNVLYAGKRGDSTFTILSAGKYSVSVRNSIATQLILTSDTITWEGLPLTAAATNVIRSISGTSSFEIGDQSLNTLLLTITPGTGINALNGDVTCAVTIDNAVATYNGQPYVQRHYDITPASNAANAAATVTLYFTQGDFNNFNSTPAHGPDLPTGPADAAGIANLRVYQYHGFSTTSLPGSYSGPAVEINPADANIIWNAIGNYWEVSFAVNGFSGFFISSQNSALLPVKLISFTGKIQENSGLLEWVTAAEINFENFEMQRSSNGINYKTITTITAAGSSNNTAAYQYLDLLGNEPVYYYRLRMNDRDGKVSYSQVIKLTNTNSRLSFVIYPNPAKEFVLIKMPALTKTTEIRLVNMSGQVLQTASAPIGSTQVKINIKGLPAGAYKIMFRDNNKAMNATLLVE